jgi:hypothetical protein
MKTSLDNISTMAIELSRAMGIDVTPFEESERCNRCWILGDKCTIVYQIFGSSPLVH